MPLALTDAELDIVMTLTSPLPPENRSDFLEAIAGELTAQGAEIGPGAVYRVARGLQQHFIELPPALRSKYG